MTDKFAFTVALMLLLPAMARPQAAKPVAMVLQVEGAVTIERNNRSEPARLADLLQVNDRIIAGNNGRVVIGHCPSSQKVIANAGARLEMGAMAVQTLGGPAPVTSALRCALPPVALGAENLEQVGGRRPRGEPIIIYTGGPISAARPVFRWEPLKEAGVYNISVLDQKGNTVWSARQPAPASEARLADSVSLESGSYEWSLVVLAGNKVIARQSAQFVLKPGSRFAEPPDDPAERLAYASAMESAGYYAEAAAIYRAIRETNPNDARFTRHLAWLYDRADLIAARDAELAKLGERR